MKLSIDAAVLVEYVAKQLNNIFPDNNLISSKDIGLIIDVALDRVDFCFKHVSHKRYHDKNQTLLNHLYSDHYIMFLWFLSNTSYQILENTNLSNKLYYLNKSLHGFDCMYDTKMPDIFLIFHGVGTMLGKAEYADFFIALQGCTVGSQKGSYPKFRKGVSLTANTSVIGECTIGDRCTISTRTTIFQKNIQDDHTAYINFENGQLEIKPAKQCYAQQFFNVDLKNL